MLKYILTTGIMLHIYECRTSGTVMIGRSTSAALLCSPASATANCSISAQLWS